MEKLTPELVAKAVWNDAEDDEYRRDQSHWRGVGRWKDDVAWQRIGRGTLMQIEAAARLSGRPLRSDLVGLEWGPGGGANAFGLRRICRRYYGIDISEKNLAEAKRMATAEGWTDYFQPVLLEGEPQSVVEKVGPEENVDVFLSTAVFQHFPSKDYGRQVLRSIRTICAPGALGMIQIRFDNGNPKYSPITSLDQYSERHITATSYPLDQFWDYAKDAGFVPLAITGISTANNYAKFLMQVPL